MAKKIKKFSSSTKSLQMGEKTRRGGEKMRRAARLFNRSIIYYIVLVILAAVSGMSGEYDLSTPTLNGFAICFLLLPAYLPLLIIGAISALTGFSIAEVCGHEVILFGICDLLLAVNAWWIIRLLAAKKQSTALLRNSRIFVLIMVGWGIFQLSCCVIQLIWQQSGLHALHDFGNH